MASDIDGVFLNTDEHAEQCSFTPSGGSARTITVVVMPQPTEIVSEQEHLVEKSVICVLAKKHATEGIETPGKGDVITYQGRVYSWVGWYGDDTNAPLLKFSSPKIINSGHQRGFGL